MSRILRKIQSYFDFDHLALYLILGTIFFLPLFFVPHFRDFFHLPKETFLTAVVILLFLLWMIESLKTRRLSVRRTAFDVPFVVFLVALGLSTLFSLSTHLSLWGKMESFTFSLFGFFILVTWCWQLIQKMGSEKFFRFALGTFLFSGMITGFLFLLVDIPYLKDIVRLGFVNTIGTTSSVFGLWIVTLFLLSLGTLLPRGSQQKMITTVAAFSTLILFPVLLRLNLQFVFVLVCLGVGLLFLLGMTFVGQVRKYILSLVFLFFLLALVKVLFPDVLSWGRNLPSEVNLSFSLSSQIVQDTVLSNTKTFLLGSGPGTFVYDFSLFRPDVLNTTPYFWTFRFDDPYNTALAIVAELGLVGTISFVILLLLSLGTVFSTFVHLRSTSNIRSFLPSEKFSSVRFEYFVFMIAWLLLTLGMFVVVYNFSLWFLWWTLLAFVILGLSYIQPELIREQQKYFTIGPQYFLLVAFGSLLFSAGIIVVASFWVKNVASEYIFSQVGKNPSQSVSLITQALHYQKGSSEYSLRLAKAYFDQSQAVLQIDPKTAAPLLSQAIDAAREARNVDPHNVRVWEILSASYIQTFPFLDPSKAQDSIARASEAIDQAIALEPTNPLFHGEKAFILQYASKFDEAEVEYLKAIALKPDYLQPSFDLAHMYEAQGTPQKAIDLYSKILQDMPENMDVLYEMGRLYYNQKTQEGDQQAEQMWKKVLLIQPNSPNTLYSLGLLAQKYGKTAQAKLFFLRVKELSPANTDIDKKIQNL